MEVWILTTEPERSVRKETLMSQEDLANVDNIEIEPLTDSDLDSVAGGQVGGSASCTCSNCPTYTCPGGGTQPQEPSGDILV